MTHESNRQAYEELNLRREIRGLPTLSRREFTRLIAMASAGWSASVLESCAEHASLAPPLSGDFAGRDGGLGDAGSPKSAGHDLPATAGSGDGEPYVDNLGDIMAQWV